MLEELDNLDVSGLEIVSVRNEITNSTSYKFTFPDPYWYGASYSSGNDSWETEQEAKNAALIYYNQVLEKRKLGSKDLIKLLTSHPKWMTDLMYKINFLHYQDQYEDFELWTEEALLNIIKEVSRNHNLHD